MPLIPMGMPWFRGVRGVILFHRTVQRHLALPQVNPILRIPLKRMKWLGF